MTEGTMHGEMRPMDAETGKPMGPMAQPGYYKGFSTLKQQSFWDLKTREVVLSRVDEIPPIRFFTEEQARLLEAICERVLPQTDRDDSHKIPIVPQIDLRLYTNSSDGYRYEDMPPDAQAYQLGLAGIDAISQARFSRHFIEIDPLDQDEILRSLHDGRPEAAQEIWQRVPVERFWMLLVADCADAYYSHPFAWDEIGFGGPAYPRAYMRLEHGEPEPWECQEQRYEWRAPQNSLSDRYEPVAGKAEGLSSPGQGGTH
ncbi:MAG: gluconate 2-dehydrogenase subunit 3 family protein [Candidatus Eremiobacteraeota bacterium]|nr:gluconate 2-dehydrogenase subunit 3 family protein [Candidatus Eremiobacteraeota bacterium]